MSPFKAAIFVGVTIGLVSFIGIKFLANRQVIAEDGRLFI
ncbi:hypothetical protein QE439_003813 [Pedobacter agri]|nr:hypothetical protein [Pedobacter agri]